MTRGPGTAELQISGELRSGVIKGSNTTDLLCDDLDRLLRRNAAQQARRAGNITVTGADPEEIERNAARD